MRASPMFAAVVLAFIFLPGQSHDGQGASLPATCRFGTMFVKSGASAGPYWCSATDTWTALAGAPGGESVPAGSILLIKTGTCPTGYTEDTDLNGRTLIGTLAANGDVGTTGGADSVTPSAHAGTAVSAHAGTAVADHASHTHTYTDVIAHTHTIPVGATDDTSAPFDRADAGTNASGANASTQTGSSGVATGTTAGPSATLTHAVTQPSNHTVTQPSDHAALDNRSAFARVIFCRKT